MKFSTWIDIGNALKEFYDTVDTVLAHRDAAQRARLGKNPFPPHKKVQRQLDANERLQNHLKSVAKQGLPAPMEPKVGLDDLLAKPGGTGYGLQKLNDVLKIRAKHIRTLEKQILELRRLEKEAVAKSKAARIVRDFWRDAIKAPLPDMGSVGKVEFFKYHQAFEKLAGSLGRTARAAERAKRKLTADLRSYQKDTEVLQSNIGTFFRDSILY